MADFIKCLSDGFVQVRQQDPATGEWKLRGACRVELPATADIITTASGEVFQVGLLGVPGIVCREDQDPSRLPNFESYEGFSLLTTTDEEKAAE